MPGLEVWEAGQVAVFTDPWKTSGSHDHSNVPLRRRGAASARRHRRVQAELMDWLRERPHATVHALVRRGFALRIVAAAERDGLVDVDLLAGRVAVRPALERAPTVTDGGRAS